MSSSLVPFAKILPSFIKRMTSQSLMERMRWAMMNFVTSGISLRKFSRMTESVWVSTAEVESSRMRIFGLLSKARAMQSLCF